MSFNLANQYANNDMYPEALNTYQVIVKNKMSIDSGEGPCRHSKANRPLAPCSDNAGIRLQVIPRDIT